MGISSLPFPNGNKPQFARRFKAISRYKKLHFSYNAVQSTNAPDAGNIATRSNRNDHGAIEWL
jgi:hypothetical protein